VLFALRHSWCAWHCRHQFLSGVEASVGHRCSGCVSRHCAPSDASPTQDERAYEPHWCGSLCARNSAGNRDDCHTGSRRAASVWPGLSWQRTTDYSRLWSHTYEPEAEATLDEIVTRASEASELATTEAPNDQKLLGKWQERVFLLHGLTQQSNA